jgi:hypothetical protein
MDGVLNAHTSEIMHRCPECNESYEKNFISDTIKSSCALM